jgi:FkbM family methyltransferase
VLKHLAKAALKRTPYRVCRTYGINRFQGIDAALANLSQRGFEPDRVIDGGAHTGDFARLTANIFPRAQYDLIEPQSACMAELHKLAKARGWIVHEAALGSGDVASLAFTHTCAPSTGAHVKEKPGDGTVPVRVATLNELFLHKISESDRVLLKLDLQGYELEALRGADKILPRIEVILAEVSFYAQAYEPTILELTTFLGSFGFQLYDIAALAGRRRDNRCHQGDFIFARAGSDLLADTAWE